MRGHGGLCNVCCWRARVINYMYISADIGQDVSVAILYVILQEL